MFFKAFSSWLIHVNSLLFIATKLFLLNLDFLVEIYFLNHSNFITITSPKNTMPNLSHLTHLLIAFYNYFFHHFQCFHYIFHVYQAESVLKPIININPNFTFFELNLNAYYIIDIFLQSYQQKKVKLYAKLIFS